MANLRDRGYGNSTEGLKLKKAPERHAREKTVAPGEASVSRGMNASQLPSPDRFRSLPQYGAVPEYSPVYPGNNAGTPLSLQFRDERDAEDAYRNGAGAYSEIQNARKQLVPSETRTSLSDEELRKRIKALQDAMAEMDASHNKFRLRKFTEHSNTEYEAPYYPYSPGEEHPGQALADYNWDVAEALDDAAQEVGASDAYKQSKWQDYVNAATTARALEAQHQHYIDNHGIPGLEDAVAEERQYGNLFQEYNNLKNEYNTRLARYLQSIGG